MVANVPNGAVLSAGINNGNGTWTLTPAQLSGLTLTPPLDFSGQINLSVSAISSENGSTANATANLPVTVSGVADAPSLHVDAAAGLENTSIALDITAALTGANENLSIVVGNVPNGAIFSAGINNGDGTWSLSPAQLGGLTVTPPANFSGTLGLSVTAISAQGRHHCFDQRLAECQHCRNCDDTAAFQLPLLRDWKTLPFR